MLEVQIGNRWVPSEMIRENAKTMIVRVFQKHRITEADSFIIIVKKGKIRTV